MIFLHLSLKCIEGLVRIILDYLFYSLNWQPKQVILDVFSQGRLDIGADVMECQSGLLN